jgi:hypothetical protein
MKGLHKIRKNTKDNGPADAETRKHVMEEIEKQRLQRKDAAETATTRLARSRNQRIERGPKTKDPKSEIRTVLTYAGADTREGG